MSAPLRLQIAIIGGGIAGTMAACVLREQHDVTVYERGEEGNIGGGQAIAFSPGSVKILEDYGFDPKRAGSVSGRGFRVYHQDGCLKKAIPIDIAKEFGAEWLMHLRADARAEILRIATSNSTVLGTADKPPRFVYGANAVSADVETGVVTFANGSSIQADLIVFADGIRSAFRGCVVGHTDTQVMSTGQSIFRFVLSADKAREIAGVLPEWWDPKKEPYFNMIPAEDGSNRIVITYPAKNFEVVNFSCICPNTFLKETGSESWFTDGDLNELLEVFKDFPESVMRSARHAEEVKIWNLKDHDPLPQYVRGRAVLIGDAAHAMTPLQGQGANQAIEDAEGLRLFLQPGITRETVPSVLEVWDSVRRPRATRVQFNTRLAGKDMNEEKGLQNMAYNWTYGGIHNALKEKEV